MKNKYTSDKTGRLSRRVEIFSKADTLYVGMAENKTAKRI